MSPRTTHQDDTPAGPNNASAGLRARLFRRFAPKTVAAVSMASVLVLMPLGLLLTRSGEPSAPPVAALIDPPAAQPAATAPVASAAPVPDGAVQAVRDEMKALGAQGASLAATLAELKHQIEQLSGIARDVGAKVERLALAQEQAARAAAESRRPAPERKSASARRAPAPLVHVPPPAILGVDLWDGAPSVSLRDGDRLRFLHEGDTVGTYTLRKVDGASGRVAWETGGREVVVGMPR